MSEFPNSTPPGPPVSPAPPQTSETTGLPENVAAGLAELFPLLGGIVIFILEKKSKLARFHAMQSIYFGAGMFLLSIAVTILSAILAFIPVLGRILGLLLGIAAFFVWIAAFVFWIIAVIKAFQGVEYSMPVIGNAVRQQLAKLGAAPVGTPPPEPPAA